MKFLSDDWHYQSKKEFWGAVIGAAVSMYQGRKAASRADDAAAAAGATRSERLQVAQDSYDQYKTTFAPNEQALVDSVDNFTARDNLNKYMEQSGVDVRKAFGKGREMQGRQAARYGLDPSDARYSEMDRVSRIDEAKAEVAGRNKARTQAEEEKIQDEDKLFSRRLAVGKFGRTGITAERDLSSAYGNVLSDQRKEEEGYAKQAGQGYGLAGKFLGKAVDGYSGGGSSDPWVDTSGTPDYGDGTMTDEYGTFSTGDYGG